MNEPKIVMAVILLLGAGLLIGIGGIIALSWTGKPAPETLNTLAATCVGGLGGMLAQTNTKGRPADQPAPPDTNEVP